MAVTLIRDCPHCRAGHTGFTFLATRHQPGVHQATSIFTCNRCGEAYAITFRTGGVKPDWVGDGAGDFDQTLRTVTGTSTVKEYPRVQTFAAPEHVSASVARCLIQASDAAARKHHDAAGSMYRKAIDLATKELDVQLAGKKLAARIEALHTAGKLTTDLKDWAHQVRLDGNDAAHDEEELTADDIKALASFSELFLTYTFTLPRRIAALKGNEDGG